MTIHYHGTPVTPRSTLLELAGAHFCVSHWEPRDVEVCHQIGQSVLLDNGAFSAWTAGQEISDWSPYYAWADQWLEHPTTLAIIPDVITGSVEEQERLIGQWPHGDRGLPVWHMHEPITRLLDLIDRFPRVCIGSSAEYATLLTPSWERRMDEAWRNINSTFQRTPYIHMLRGLQLVVGYRWPFASVDSTDVARNHNRDGNTATKMRARWDAAQCPPRFICRGEQLELVA